MIKKLFILTAIIFLIMYIWASITAWSPDTTPPQLKQAIEDIEYCIEIHQDYADRPEWCNDEVGSVEFHQMWVEKYKNILKCLEDKDES